MEEANKPKVVDPKDIVIETTGTTVCGSDMHLLAYVILASLPRTAGSERLTTSFASTAALSSNCASMTSLAMKPAALW